MAAARDGLPPSSADAREMSALEAHYRDLWRVRRFDELVIELFHQGVVKGTAHSCVGQEAVAVGACAALEGRSRARR